jgi:hypothetical protein
MPASGGVGARREARHFPAAAVVVQVFTGGRQGGGIAGNTTVGSGATVSFVRSNPVMKWSDLQEFGDFTREFVAAAQAAKKAGKSADDAAKSLNLPAKYKDYNMTRAAEDVRLVYEESN